MESLHERVTALEHIVHDLNISQQALKRQVRWWRHNTYALVVLGLTGLMLGVGRADDKLQTFLDHLLIENKGRDLVIRGANLHIVNGLGRTDATNSLGNLIVGYNATRAPDSTDVRTGSHNLIVGDCQNYSSYGGLVVGRYNTLSGQYASVSGGAGNTASGQSSSVSGGEHNTASDYYVSISGGEHNTASGQFASISGGFKNRANGFAASISGGRENTSSFYYTSISGGFKNTASDYYASVSGGRDNTVNVIEGWAGGSFHSPQDASR